ncbi:LytR/AlgR family response regulator transcription factor [Spirosoma harenae]
MFFITYKPDEILFLSGSVNYSNIHYTNGKVLLVYHTLVRIQQQHLPDFLRISKSLLVNPRYVVGWQRSEYTRGRVTLSSGHTMPISRRRLSRVGNFLKGYRVNPAQHVTHPLIPAPAVRLVP